MYCALREATINITLISQHADTATGAAVLQTGYMQFDELREYCLAGKIKQEVPDLIIKTLEDAEKPDVSFADFLVYLPMFISAHKLMVSNPLDTPDHESMGKVIGHSEMLETEVSQALLPSTAQSGSFSNLTYSGAVFSLHLGLTLL